MKCGLYGTAFIELKHISIIMMISPTARQHLIKMERTDQNTFDRKSLLKIDTLHGSIIRLLQLIEFYSSKPIRNELDRN